MLNLLHFSTGMGGYRTEVQEVRISGVKDVEVQPSMRVALKCVRYYSYVCNRTRESKVKDEAGVL